MSESDSSSDSDQSEDRMDLDPRLRLPISLADTPQFLVQVEDNTIIGIDERLLRVKSRKIEQKFQNGEYTSTPEAIHVVKWMDPDAAGAVRKYVSTHKFSLIPNDRWHVVDSLRAARWFGLEDLVHEIFTKIIEDLDRKQPKVFPVPFLALLYTARFSYTEETEGLVDKMVDMSVKAMSYGTAEQFTASNWEEKLVSGQIHPIPRAVGWKVIARTLAEKKGTLTVKVAELCKAYIDDARGAKADINTILTKVQDLQAVLGEVQNLLDGPQGKSLEASQKLQSTLSKCKSDLKIVEIRLNALPAPSTGAPSQGPSKPKRIFRLFKHDRLQAPPSLRTALKWPFEKAEVEKIVSNLERAESSISLAIQIDGVKGILNVEDEIRLHNIPVAQGATVQSFENEYDPTCHPDTRKELLAKISKWATDQNTKGTRIFWLSGAAGTGKSTIARTVAKRLDGDGLLGASFFFRRGDGDRANASKLVPTLIGGLIGFFPELGPGVSQVIKGKPCIFMNGLTEQFEKALLEPLGTINPKQRQHTILVIDALDECENDSDILTIVRNLGKVRDLKNVDVRIFITSRRETAIQLVFEKIPGAFQELVLHEIGEDQVKLDISIFLNYEFTKIRTESRHKASLPSGWPGQRTTEALASMASPLFIVAATICRFISDEEFLPNDQLEQIIADKEALLEANPAKSLSYTYLQVLNQRLKAKSDNQIRKIVKEFRDIIGTVVLLETPLSLKSLSGLTGIDENIIRCRLDGFQSVLQIPPDSKPDAPVQTFHLSFREFLLHPQTSAKTKLYLDEVNVHNNIFGWCIALMERALKRDICGLADLGVSIREIPIETVRRCIPKELEYACRYWSYHFIRGVELGKAYDGVKVYNFIHRFLLEWLEVGSLLGILSDIIHGLRELELVVSSFKDSTLLELLRDADRSIQFNVNCIQRSPLQIYSSALLFLPENSLVRKVFSHQRPEWMLGPPRVQSNWDSCLQTLDSHDTCIRGLQFSRDGRILASIDSSEIVIWDLTSSRIRQRIVLSSDRRMGPEYFKQCMVISPDGIFVAGFSDNDFCKSLCVWEVASGELVKEKDLSPAAHIAFSSDSRCLLVCDGSVLVVLDTASWCDVRSVHLDGCCCVVSEVAFGPYDGLIALHGRTEDMHGVAQILFPASGNTFQLLTLDDLLFTGGPIFSQDGRSLALGGLGKIYCWQLSPSSEGQTPEKRDVLHSTVGHVRALSWISTDRLAVTGGSGAIEIWDISSQTLSIIIRQSSVPNTLAASPKTQLLASADDKLVYIWDTRPQSTTTTSTTVKMEESMATPEIPPPWWWECRIRHIATSRNKEFMAAAFGVEEFKSFKFVFWEASSDGPKLRFISETQEGWQYKLVLSTDGGLLALYSIDQYKYIVTVWDTTSCTELATTELYAPPTDVQISPDNSLLAVSCRSEISIFNLGVRDILDGATPRLRCVKVLKIETQIAAYVSSMRFAIDSRYMACLLFQPNLPSSMIRVWSTVTYEEVRGVDIEPTAAVEHEEIANDTCCCTSCWLKGPFEVETEEGTASFGESGSGQTSQSSTLPRVVGNWVTQSGKNILWLPPQYRPESEMWCQLGDFLVFCPPSGGINWMRLNFMGYGKQ
ncbi:hypothetical protein ABW19_dt0204445 [Dactylella cylindrospora]|nr:hypothetical protein ABW19_dt0204445 [Dactylella cylindrospora]